MENQQNNYATPSIKIASFLLSNKISLKGVERPETNNGKVIFIFEPSGKIKSLIQDYFLDRATCSPKLLFENYDNLKSVIFREIDI
jgi:hypothetical protein